MNTITAWFSELNWKSILYHALGLFLLFGTQELRPQVTELFGSWAPKVIHASELLGVAINIWARSPAVVPLGTIQPQSNVK